MEKTVETKQCKACNIKFDITDKDLEFYEKVSPIFNGKKYNIPTPTLCPDCRQQRRLSFLNHMKLYNNICHKCDKKIISRFNNSNGIKNYCNECWSGEDWNQLEKGVNINFNLSLFEQFNYLVRNTIYQNLIGSSSNIRNNAIYTNHTSEINDSYFVFEANNINNSIFSFALKNSNYIVDSSFVGNSEYIYECIDCYDMFNTFYSKGSYGSKFSYFLNNCYNCSYCIGCINLINKDYYIFNKQVSKKEYEGFLKKLSNNSYLESFKNKVNKFFSEYIVKSNNLIGSEDCSGDNIINSKNCINSFDILECIDCRYSSSINYSSDLGDISSYGEESHKMYESVSVGRFSKNILFSSIIGKGDKLTYCIDVKKSTNCFFCVNLEGKQYCILNKQYTKEEYNNLVPKIIEHMKKTGEWGEFFPASISPFGYNETVANEYDPINPPSVPTSSGMTMGLPLTGEGSKTFQFSLSPVRGKMSEGQIGVFNWSTYESPFPKVDKIIPADKLPDNIKDIPDDILNWAIECEVTKKPFKIIKQELDFYRKHNLPIPRRHPDQRHLDRMALRNPRKLFDRKCDKCGIDMKTTYSPDRPEIVYCEECYNKEVY